ncbi:hypothetical protein SCOCK_20383 [Actinacidiphila cocklensis]|uniref:Uncharacterized protein n=1 Tax=Actinacidiphila cocklensis TaxID=887465 RepID=A0A9W4DTQ2_9ACTN|nr:hypothetical protein SCOCK_20383 [Actinacidiphila cocklensis]
MGRGRGVDCGGGLEPRPRRRGLLPPHRPGRLPGRPARRPARLGVLGRGLLTRLRLPRLLPGPPRPPRQRAGPGHLEGRAAARGGARRRARRGARAAGALHTVGLPPGVRQRPLHRAAAVPRRRGRRRHGRVGDAVPPRRDQRVRQRVLPRGAARLPQPVADRGAAHRAGPAGRQRARHRLRRDPPRPPGPAHRPAVRGHARGCGRALRRADRRPAGGRGGLDRRPRPPRGGHVPGRVRRPGRVLPLHPHVLGPCPLLPRRRGLRHDHPRTGLTPPRGVRPAVRLPPHPGGGLSAQFRPQSLGGPPAPLGVVAAVSTRRFRRRRPPFPAPLGNAHPLRRGQPTRGARGLPQAKLWGRNRAMGHDGASGDHPPQGAGAEGRGNCARNPSPGVRRLPTVGGRG